MTIGDILVNTKRANLNNLLPLSEVKTKKDFAKFKKKGYTVGMTAGEFQEKYPLLPIENIYASYNILSSLYYCEPQNPTIPIVVNYPHLKEGACSPAGLQFFRHSTDC